MKKFLFFMAVLFASANIWSQTITKTGGWLESAFVEWSPVTGAGSYNVYYTGGGKTDQLIDNQLVRNYGTYFRADVLGLAAGTYTLKISAIKPDGVTVISSTTTSSLTVQPQERNGFAWNGGRVPGGYNMDGTPKTGAVILYITQNTKNTISVSITGASANPCVGLQNILYGIKKGKDTRPFIIRLIGNITDMSVMEGGDVTIENANNAASTLTIEGVGNDAVANGWGVRLKSASNIEVRNLGFMNCNSTAGDNVGMQDKNDHIWVHNCDMFYGNAGSDADQIKGDGALDNKGSTYCTFSYNHFWDNGKCSLLGLSEGTTTGLYVTYHHNWFDHSDSRHPRVRYYSAHIYNNYFDGNSKYGAGSTLGSSLFMEGNYFRNAKHPMMASMQGTDVWNETTQKNDPGNMGTFSGEAGGTIKEFNNKFDYDATAISKHYNRFVSYGTKGASYDLPGNKGSFVDFDAYSADSREEQVPATVKSFLGANTYNNFDTDPTLYVKNLVIDSPDDAKTKVMQYAGRVSGGDLKFTYDNAVEDYNYIVIAAEKTAVTNYTTTMVNVQGESAVVVPVQNLSCDTKNEDQTVTSGSPIVNIVFTWSGDATSATVTGLPAGITSTLDSTAKTLTLSGTPTETSSYTVTTVGAGSSASDSGTITVTTTQILTPTNSDNISQKVVKNTAIDPIIFTWSGDATDADVTGLPDGITAFKDTNNQTITLSGAPSTVGVYNYKVSTSGAIGTPGSLAGTITVVDPESGTRIHNFTDTYVLTNTFYKMTGNLSNSKGTVSFNDGQNTLSLKNGLKFESGVGLGVVNYTTTQPSTLTLVFAEPTALIKVDGVTKTASGNVITMSIAPGDHTLIKASGTTTLYYIRTEFTSTSLGLGDNNVKTQKITLYPNPVTDQLYFSGVDQKIENITIYSITGAVVKTISKDVQSIDVSNLRAGNYLVKVTTENGSFTQKIIKK